MRAKKIILIFSVVLILVIGGMMILSPEYQYTYKKCGEVSLDIPESLLKDFRQCDIEDIRWYLAMSKKWCYLSRGEETFAKKVCNKQDDEYIDIFVYDAHIYIEEHQTGNEDKFKFIDLNSTNVFDMGVYRPKLFQFSSMGKGVMSTDLYLKFSDDFYVNIREYSRDEKRTRTIKAIEEIAELFKNRDEKLAILNNDDSPKTEGINNLEIINYGGMNHLVRGYVDLDTKCKIFIKVLDKETNELYFEQDDNILKCIPGWDKDENYYHYFEFTLPILHYADTGEYKVELWSEDEDGGSGCVFDKVVFLDFGLDGSY